MALTIDVLIGVTLLTKCVASYSRIDRGKTILAIYVATKDVLLALRY